MTTGRRLALASARAAWTVVSLGLVALIAANAARAQVPTTMNFQGLLLDAAGEPKNGSVTLWFQLYDQPEGGIPLWLEIVAGVAVTDGVYDVVLGTTNPLTPEIFSGGPRFLQLSVDGEVLAPRKQLLVVPYAIRANSASTANVANNAAAAGTAVALASNGANCPPGQVPQGINAAGEAEGCVISLQSLGQDTAPTLGGDLDAAGNSIDDVGGISATDGQWTLNQTAQPDYPAESRADLRIRTTNVHGAAEFSTGYGGGMGEFMVKFMGFDADNAPNDEKLFGYINKAGHMYFRTSVTVSGVMNGPDGPLGPCQATVPGGTVENCRIRPAEYGATAIPSATSMFGVWSDVPGPGILSRSNNVDPPSKPFMAMTYDGTPTFEVESTGEVRIWDGDSHFGMLDMTNLSAERTYTFPDQSGEVLLKSGTWGTSFAIPMTSGASGNDVVDSGIRVDNTSPSSNYVGLPSDTGGSSELRFYESADHPGGNYISLRAAVGSRDLTGNSAYDLAKFTRAHSASASRGPVIGAVAIASSLDTAQKLCELQYDSAETGVSANCLPGSAKTYDGTSAAPMWIGANYPNDNCEYPVTPGSYFEVVCTVED